MNRILEGDVFEMLPTIEPGSVDCAVTSPPYWALRSYLPKGHPLKHLELGSEKTPQAYIEKMVAVFELVKRALADHGTVWCNVGDTYFGDSPVRSKASEAFSEEWDFSQTASRGGARRSAKGQGGLVPGCLTLIPQRLAIALVDAGWLVRSIVIWHKPAPMPQSVSGWMWRKCRVKVKAQVDGKQSRAGRVTAKARDCIGGEWQGSAEWKDCPGCSKCAPNAGLVLRRGSWRPTSAYEPVLMLAKSGKYFADGEAVKQPYAKLWDATTNGVVDRNGLCPEDGGQREPSSPEPTTGANLRDVWKLDLEKLSKEQLIALMTEQADLSDIWKISAEALSEKHYAAYPTELVHRCLAAGTSAKGYCVECGKPWARVVESYDTGRTQKMPDGFATYAGGHGSIHRDGAEEGEPGQSVMMSKTLGWRPTCPCKTEAPPRAGLVLDPFSGSGRTAVECQRMGLDFVGVELNSEYVEMSKRILKRECPLFA